MPEHHQAYEARIEHYEPENEKKSPDHGRLADIRQRAEGAHHDGDQYRGDSPERPVEPFACREGHILQDRAHVSVIAFRGRWAPLRAAPTLQRGNVRNPSPEATRSFR
jgi:hypothetical protein